MPRLIEERWMGVGWGVQQEKLQAAGPDGQPLFDAHGLPKMVPHTTLVFVIDEPGKRRVVKVPFTDDKKQELVAALTGGIVVPAPGNGHIEV